uniref:Uncharacterized protein n=1 Tax=Caenorhabditis japonica TaxID=281687 RepID=A0A8R1ING4_CAEJA
MFPETPRRNSGKHSAHDTSSNMHDRDRNARSRRSRVGHSGNARAQQNFSNTQSTIQQLRTPAPLPSHEHNQQSNGTSSGGRRSSRRGLNPCAYGGASSLGQEMKHVTIPCAHKMERMTRLLRPFIYGNEEDYEEVEMKPPPPSMHVPIPKIEPVMPPNKMYIFETKMRYDEHGNLLEKTEKAFEYTLGAPNDPIVMIDNDADFDF